MGHCLEEIFCPGRKELLKLKNSSKNKRYFGFMVVQVFNHDKVITIPEITKLIIPQTMILIII